MLDYSFHSFANALRERLAEPLPGPDAHLKMASRSRLRMAMQPNERTRRSAVLIVFYPYQNSIYLPLILRPQYDGVHAGQMAFPGGRMERSDESLIRTALREAQEEVGIRVTDVTVLGKLTEIYIPPSNFFVQPVVGILPYRPDFYPDPREVEHVVEVSLDELMDETIVGENAIEVRGVAIDAPFYQLQGFKVWGATAMMISELLTVINSVPKQNS
ncbi:NUDIX hydrolase [Larkinella terrae]|uniref:NUDIX domain-containing protein n=1 Tax=Larkinella terrae TaxID=2025311 RepID=A0A7K0EPI9_9BACT|nr:CoA pyrophosphatase [Larkinella terrae]MRS63735.1 NUDIX domain-containing protein [Larkinella terrae]